MNPRYQVFVSSTFRDLREERQAALEAVIELNHFPAGMEAFPAADATPWDLIRTIIADSDYYVLIVGGKYGSTGPAGISYTEMEYDLAVELGKPVLAFLHGCPDQIPAGLSELEPLARERLDQLRAKITSRLCRTWSNKDELKAAVLMSLVHAVRTKPAMGWIRNEGPENQELLRRLAGLQARFDELEVEAASLREVIGRSVDSSQYERLEETYDTTFTLGSDLRARFVPITWSEIFFGVADEMLIPCTEHKLRHSLKTVVAGAIANSAEMSAVVGHTPVSSLVRTLGISSDTLKAITRQLMAHGLIEPQHVLRQHGDEKQTSTTSDRCWVLTGAGRSRYLKRTAVGAKNAG